MLAVAAVAVVCAAESMRRRAVVYRARAAYYAEEEERWLEAASGHAEMAADIDRELTERKPLWSECGPEREPTEAVTGRDAEDAADREIVHAPGLVPTNSQAH
jgi:hypothetical protein